MATKHAQQSLPDMPKDLPSPAELAWIRKGLELQFKSLERARAKFPPGSGAYQAMTSDLEEVRQLKEKLA